MTTLSLFHVSANAINYGEPDGNRHPYVGIMVAKDESNNPLWRCSGTLISESVFLTAGHCTQAPAERAEIWFEPDLADDPNEDRYGYPYDGETSVSGYTSTHPDYLPNAFFLYDVGVVILDAPLPMAEYGALPAAPYALDSLAKRRGKQDVTITAVGYGLQRVRSNPSGPDFTLADLRRDVAVLNLVGVNGVFGLPGGVSVKVSGNARTGGTCFGDSGGPLFLNDSNIVVAVTSFGINGNCAGVGGGYRLDMPDDLDWLASVLEPVDE